MTQRILLAFSAFSIHWLRCETQHPLEFPQITHSCNNVSKQCQLCWWFLMWQWRWTIHSTSNNLTNPHAGFLPPSSLSLLRADPSWFFSHALTSLIFSRLSSSLYLPVSCRTIQLSQLHPQDYKLNLYIIPINALYSLQEVIGIMELNLIANKNNF